MIYLKDLMTYGKKAFNKYKCQGEHVSYKLSGGCTVTPNLVRKF